MVVVTIRIAELVKSYDIPVATPQCTPPSILNPVTGKCELQCSYPQIFNPLTGRCESPPSAPQAPLLPIAPTPPTPQAPEIAPTPVLGGKVINISTLTNAFRTQNVPILVTAVCTSPPSPIDGEDATLYVDGKSVAVQTVIKGITQFSYVFDTGLHKIQVSIPKSLKCPSEGSASLQIDVSSEVPSTLERLRIEQQVLAATEQQIAAARQQARQLLTTTPAPLIPGG